MFTKFKRNSNIVEAVKYIGKNSKEIMDILPFAAMKGSSIVFKQFDNKCTLRIGDFLVKDGELFYSFPENVFKKYFKKGEDYNGK